MTPTPELRTTLRLNLDESIPEGGTAADTNFTDAEIDTLLLNSASIEEASYKGWVLKATRVYRPGRLVSSRVGQESYTWASLKETYDAYMWMANYWRGLIPDGSGAISTGASRVLVPTVPLRSNAYLDGFDTSKDRECYYPGTYTGDFSRIPCDP